jgi:hypothetical protein
MSIEKETDERFLSSAAVCKRYGIHPATLDKWIGGVEPNFPLAIPDCRAEILRPGRVISIRAADGERAEGLQAHPVLRAEISGSDKMGRSSYVLSSDA